MEERKLDFEKNKVEILTLDELKGTYKEVAPNGLPTFGIYHYECIERVLDVLAKVCTPQILEIFAANNGDCRYPGVSVIRDLIPQLGAGSLGVHTLRRVYANIETGTMIDEGITLNVAFSFNQRGIQVGIGPHVHVCHNQTILQARHLLSTYAVCGAIPRDGSYRDFDSLMTALETLMNDYNRVVFDCATLYERLKTDVYDIKQVLCLFGALLRHRVMYDSKEQHYKTSEIYPLSGVQLNQAMERFCIQDASSSKKSWTGWELMNILNQDMKPHKADIPMLMPHMLRLAIHLYHFSKHFHGNGDGE